MRTIYPRRELKTLGCQRSTKKIQ